MTCAPAEPVTDAQPPVHPNAPVPHRVAAQRPRRELWSAALRATLLVAMTAGLLEIGLPLAVVFVALIGAPVVVAMALYRRNADFAFWVGYGLVFAIYVIVRKTADDTGMPVLYDYVIVVDRWLGAGTLWSLRLQHWWRTDGVLANAAIGVYLSFFIIPSITAAAVWIFRRDAFPRYVIAVACMYAAALAVHYLLPTAPPWLAGATGRVPFVARPFHEVFLNSTLYRQGQSVAANPVAAMPSVHMALTTLVALGWSLFPVGRYFGALYALLMATSLVFLGEHYVIDILAGVALAVGSWMAAGHIADQMPARFRLPGHHRNGRLRLVLACFGAAWLMRTLLDTSWSFRGLSIAVPVLIFVAVALVSLTGLLRADG